MLDIKIVQNATDMASCIALRRAVFMGEQNVSEADEIDGEDDHCTHVIATLNKCPIGTARFQIKDGSVKIQRVCVTRDHRGKHYGTDIILFIVDHVKTTGQSNRVYLGAQTYALPFYEKLGFTAYRTEYMDAGIPHIDMERLLDQP